ncbi:MAG: endolytic transglycosylase MltG [Acidobacteriaceae bacterium]|nr:endolytic transglycosylase MltG [Acidobacteriaceae bacterium]
MPSRRGRVRRFLAIIAALSIFVILVGSVFAGYWYFGPYQGFDAETFVELEHGMSSRQIAGTLERQGVVKSRWAFLFIRLLHSRAPLQAGEYRFGSPQTPWQVFEEIRKGETFYEELTIPEGSNIFDIADILARGDTVTPADFLKAAADPAMIKDLDPLAPNLEGYLFPSTYRVTHRTTALQLCQTMTAEFRKVWGEIGGTARKADTHRLTIIASLVEKETAMPPERPLVAAVFDNRLAANMPLQCDPTTVYAAQLENHYKGVIHKSDLASTNPYNTYTHAGLPPGPIANAGISSLRAALHPADAAYMYFVANPNGSGTHHFSATLEEHEKAVLAYRQGTHR